MSARPKRPFVEQIGSEGVLLVGGTTNRGLIVRVGDTVRRPARPTGQATRALLDHLDRVGFDGAPRHLGVDTLQREVLSYVPGAAVIEPYPSWALTDRALASVARLLRRFHDAAASFDPHGHEWPEPVPSAFTGPGVTHNDPNLDNVIFRNGLAVALIDFDLAGPGRREWDVGAAARLWCPLRIDEDITDARRGRALQRFRRFVDAYEAAGHGVPDAAFGLDRDLVVAAVRGHLEWAYAIVRDGAERGHPVFSEQWHGGGAERARRTARYYRLSERDLRQALAA